MNKTAVAARRAIKAAFTKPPALRFLVVDTPVKCSQCGGDAFRLSLPSARKIAGYSLECANCSHLEYFRRKPVERSDNI